MPKIKKDGDSYSIVMYAVQKFIYKEKTIIYIEISIKKDTKEGGVTEKVVYVPGIYIKEKSDGSIEVERIQVRAEPNKIEEVTVEERLEIEKRLTTATGASQILFWPEKKLKLAIEDTENETVKHTNKTDDEVLESL